MFFVMVNSDNHCFFSVTSEVVTGMLIVPVPAMTGGSIWSQLLMPN